MNSQFVFLKSEWPAAFDAAEQAESAVNADPRAACANARRALEVVVRWLFDFDPDFKRPYDRSLAALLAAPSFRQCVPPATVAKTGIIRDLGNRAVHSERPVPAADGLSAIKELFHITYWFARYYAKNWQSEGATFDPARLPPSPAVVIKQTTAQLKQVQADLEARDRQLAEERAARLKHETEGKALAEEIASLQAEVKAAKLRAELIPDPHDYSEAETRDRFIDLMLREAGWGEDGWKNGRDIEFEVSGMPPDGGKGYVDYVLWGDDGKPLGLVEAKRTKKDPVIGQQQAKLYADCLEKQFGQRPVIFYSNGYETWLWDDASYPPRAVQGLYQKDELELMVQRRTSRRDLLAERINKRIVERPYQVEAIRAVSQWFTQKHRRGLVVMATGSGKTRMVIALVDAMMRANWAKRVLFLADRTALVNQTCNAFKAHLPDSGPVNLVTDKSSVGRVYVSTYPTMMGFIEAQRFGVGHFDLIVIDEAHRSVYQKYRAIFEYFDGMLLGLTATPRDEVDHDTYSLFELGQGASTFAYDLEPAVRDGYLVPPKAVSVPLRFQREGIGYDELSDAEKAQWEQLEWDDEGNVPDRVEPEAVNRWLFNTDTVDKVLAHLIERGIKVAGGDRLGKTIIFAKNDDHADFIIERFDHAYPRLRGQFARKITHEITFAQSLIDAFSVAEKSPHIAVSVDMLDTGIDVPEVVNLVFFKLVRSKTKFWQMIGRGTRLCPDLFGPGMHKTMFYVFDYCQNFEFFHQNPDGIEGGTQRSLSANLFAHRLELHQALGILPADADQKLIALRSGLADLMHAEVSAMNVENFLVRPRRRLVEQFAERAGWDQLSPEQYNELNRQLAGLPNELPSDDEMAKRFDLLMLKLQLAVLNHEQVFTRLQAQVREIAQKLSEKKDIPMVSEQMPLILEVAGSDWWADVTLPMLEQARSKLRDLTKFIERGERKIVYTDFKDEIGREEQIQIEHLATATAVADYRAKMLAFLKDHQQDEPIRKLRGNERLTGKDLEHLEKLLFEASDLGDRQRFEAAYGKQADLPTFIRSLVGMDRGAAQRAFARFLEGSRYNAQQIQFVNYLIEDLTRHGAVEVERLYEAPYSDLNPLGLAGLFKQEDADAITQILSSMHAEQWPGHLAG